MGLFSSKNNDKNKQDKGELIHLQNIVFNSKESSLMASPEFLKEMADRYVSKRLRLINQNLANISTTRSPISYFNYCDIVDESLDELIALEKYYKFKKPLPSEFKEQILAHREHSIATMMNRAWKVILNKVSTTNGVPDDPAPFEGLLAEMKRFEDRMTPVNIAAIEMYHNSLYGKGNSPEDENEDDELDMLDDMPDDAVETETDDDDFADMF